jgi:hypothetical protein
MTRWLALVLAGAAGIAACAAQTEPSMMLTSNSTASTAPKSVLPSVIPRDVTSTLKNPSLAHKELCQADADHKNFPDDADTITKTFCQDVKPGGVMPTPTSFADLQKQLGLEFKDPNGGNGVGGNPAFALLAHSSALTARKVSTLTPTAFIFTPPPADGKAPTDYTVLAFDPGEAFVEVASYDPTAAKVNFYVVFFDKECGKAAGGCTYADMLTPNQRTGWSNLRVYEDTTDLDNTIFDCHVCHQPVDKKDPFLRMQEIEAPFTHWFSTATEGGHVLLDDFHKAHGTGEDYGGIPAALIDKSDPSKLAALVTSTGAGNQPNLFPSATIEKELKASAAGQPAVNVPAGKSATWQQLYDRAALGEFIAPPYHDVKVTDPKKLAKMTTAYQSWISGKAQDLPDIREVFLDTGLRDMGFAPKAGLAGRQLLVQLCQECHNANLDMTISREQFLVDELDAMTRAEKDVAIARLNTAIDNRLAMPPALFHTITSDEKQLMIKELQK